MRTSNKLVGSLNKSIPKDEDAPIDDEMDALSVGEVIPGYSRYCQVKAILERKYGKHISEQEMNKILTVVLATMPHEIKCKRRYGEEKRTRGWRAQLDKEDV